MVTELESKIRAGMHELEKIRIKWKGENVDSTASETQTDIRYLLYEIDRLRSLLDAKAGNKERAIQQQRERSLYSGLVEPD
jgi:hypothetical protein